jgi:hypothetical protein
MKKAFTYPIIGLSLIQLFIIIIQQWKIKDLEFQRSDLLIAQGGYLVAMHRYSPREGETVQNNNLLRVLAAEAFEKIQSEEASIMKHVPPQDSAAFSDMKSGLIEIIKKF